VIRIEDLHAGYGRFAVLRGVSLEVSPEQCTLIIGPNGAGKTTLLPPD
jgi:ABC-type branched-subunit amino acid transport system ATPase component